MTSTVINKRTRNFRRAQRKKKEFDTQPKTKLNINIELIEIKLL